MLNATHHAIRLILLITWLGSAHAQANPAPSRQSLYAEFESSRDYRALFESLLQRKTPGSGYYAIHLLRRCASQRALQLPPPGTSNAQQAARQLLLDRCASFTDAELSYDRRMRLLSDPRVADPFRTLRDDWQAQQGNPARRREILAQAFRTGDVLLLDHMGATAFYRESGDISFDGKTYGGRDGGPVLMATWSAAVCEATGQACGVTDPYVSQRCATEDRCHASRKELMLEMVSAMAIPNGRALFIETYPKMLDAIINKRVEAFDR